MYMYLFLSLIERLPASVQNSIGWFSSVVCSLREEVGVFLVPELLPQSLVNVYCPTRSLLNTTLRQTLHIQAT